MKTRNWLIIIFLFFLFIFSKEIISFISDYLWFGSEGLNIVFKKTIISKILMGLIAGVTVFFIIGINYLIFLKLKPQIKYDVKENIIEVEQSSKKNKYLKYYIIFLIAVGVIAGIDAVTKWPVLMYFLNSTSFNIKDPVFFKDVSYYVFILPFIKYLFGLISFTTFVSFIMVILGYMSVNSMQYVYRELRFTRASMTHIFVLAAILFFLKGMGFYFQKLDLLTSSRGFIYGIMFSDMYARIPVLKALMFLSFIMSVICIYSIFKRNWKIIFYGAVILFIFYFLGFGIYSGIIQKFVVVPNEIEKEKRFISHNIDMTSKAFNLNKIKVRSYPAKDNLTAKDISSNYSIIDNIKLWENEPLLKSFSQLQEIRSYYKFYNIDNDRYFINGRITQTMLSPREIAYEKIPGNLWMNRHLIYTHGYGVCLGSANKITSEGFPELYIKDVPPVFLNEIKIDRPEIYFGEETEPYSIVNTDQKEFDYPSGENNVYTSYKGSGGVKIDSLFKKLLFAFEFSDRNIFFSSDINSDSRIMYHKKIRDRVSKAAPMLVFDNDPYMIISEGKLYWILDGYSVLANYPCSQPSNHEGINYIRNSVKAVVDAYNGKITLYACDTEDPVIKSQMKIFPGIFKDISMMSEDIKKHVRYPVAYFRIQAEMFSVYHMKDEQVFYNKEDIWKISKSGNKGSDDSRSGAMDPYYTILKLPEEKDEKFILMVPFSPLQKDNMIAWMAADCSSKDYGQLIVYIFPKEKLVYGPVQIKARIDQDTEISKQLTLWGQMGSSVIRGDMITVPVEDSLIYVEPLYLAAQKSQIPELKRIILVYAGNIVMEDTLNKAISTIFGTVKEELKELKKDSAVLIKEKYDKKINLKDLIDQTVKSYEEIKDSFRDLNWNKLQEKFNQHQKDLEDLKKAIFDKNK